MYQDMGYTGIIVTDHFYRGNCGINRNLPWEQWVHQFCRGYEDAREEGARRGLDVFFGWEEYFNGDEYLIYGLDKEWLLAHPRVRLWTRKEQFDEVKLYGGCVVQAHPFRQRHYINCINLSAGCVDGVEAANMGNADQSNDALAWLYAKRLKLPVTAGTDTHSIEGLKQENAMGVYLDKKMETITDYVEAILNDTLGPVKMPPGRCDIKGSENVTLPVDIRDKKDKSTGRDLWDFLGI